MKKYVSCIVLVVLCLICGMVFYANANEIFAPNVPNNNTGELSTDVMGGGNGLIEDETLPPKIKTNGTILSERLTYLNLRIEWEALQASDNEELLLSCNLYADADENTITINGGGLSINGEANFFEKTTATKDGTLLLSITKELNDIKLVEISAFANASILDKNGVKLEKIQATGNLIIDESFKKISSKHLINFEHISQFPSLPSGDEITCLAMVLNYLKYDVDKNDLCDLYLAKGPVGYTKPTEANVGNPESNYNSYGCLPPVIINAANKFSMVNGGKHTALDISNSNMDVLYSCVSKDIPVIVWVCENFDITPQISRIWMIDGEAYYAKSNSCTMVLVGYDFEKNTVTLANPKGNVFEVRKDLFEARYGQMGSYGIVITD